MISSVAAAIAALRRELFYEKTTSVSTAGADKWHSGLALAGDPAAGAAAGSENGRIPTKATAGFPNFPDPPAGLAYSWVALEGKLTVAQIVRMVDVAWDNSALELNSTADQTFTQPALTRHTDGEGLEIWGQCFSAWSATAATLRAYYTNPAGTPGQIATYAWPATLPVVGQAFRFQLAAGDSGVLSIQKFNSTVAHAVAGNLGLMIVKPLKTFAVDASKASDLSKELVKLGNIPIDDDAALMLLLSGGATTGVIQLFPQLGAG